MTGTNVTRLARFWNNVPKSQSYEFQDGDEVEVASLDMEQLTQRYRLAANHVVDCESKLELAKTLAQRTLDEWYDEAQKRGVPIKKPDGVTCRK